jgi:3D (Asp-Asp-Asp) domain-containing protein
MFLSFLICSASSKHVHRHHKDYSTNTVYTDFKLTGYRPIPEEGGPNDCKGNKLQTLQSYMKGEASYVSIAVDKSVIPLGKTVTIEGFTKNGSPVKFYSCDTGVKGHIIDICVAADSNPDDVNRKGVKVTF